MQQRRGSKSTGGWGGMKTQHIIIDNKSYLGSDVNHLGGADGGQMSNQV